MHTQIEHHIPHPAEIAALLRGEMQSITAWLERWDARRFALHVGVIVLGAGLYGAAMGWWRDPQQALFTAVKFPIIILVTTMGNALLNAMLAPLLGLNIPFRQSFSAILMSFTVACAILGAFSPVMAFMVWNAPPISPETVQGATYNLIKLANVALIAFAGITGNARLYEENSTPMQVPPQIPPVIPPAPGQLGYDPSERAPIPNIVGAIDAILRHPRRLMFQLRQPEAPNLIAKMIFVAIVCSLVYGVVVGTFSNGDQLWAAPVKIAIGLMISALICLPSLYIFTCLSGSQSRLVEVCGLLAGLLMLMTILLIGFAPVAWIFSESTESLKWMGALHLVFWFIATIFGLRFLEAGFSHSNARSHAGFHTWVIIFLLVAVQMTTALRPILGKSETFLPKEKQFFIAHWAECLNAQDSKPADSRKSESRY